jgi:hypothetical protein
VLLIVLMRRYPARPRQDERGDEVGGAAGRAAPS